MTDNFNTPSFVSRLVTSIETRNIRFFTFVFSVKGMISVILILLVAVYQRILSSTEQGFIGLLRGNRKGLGISKHFSERSAFGPFQDQRYTPGLLNYALRHSLFRFCDSTAALICGMWLFWGRRLLTNPHRFIKKWLLLAEKMGVLTFAVPNYKTVLGRKISFPHTVLGRVSCSGCVFLLSRGRGGGA